MISVFSYFFHRLYSRATIVRCSPPTSAFSLLDNYQVLDLVPVSRCDSNNRVKEVGITYCSAIESTPFHYVAIVVHTLSSGILGNLGFSRTVERYGFRPSLESFAMLVGIFSSTRMHDEVRSLLKSIYDYYNRNRELRLFLLLSELVGLSNGSITLLQAYAAIVKVLAESSMLEDALIVYIDAKSVGLELGIPLCNLLLNFFVKRNEVEMVNYLFHDIKSTGPPPNVYTYCIMLDLYTRKDTLDMNKAEMILLEMEANGMNPNAIAYGSYLRGLCIDKTAEIAWYFLQDLHSRGFPCNTRCFNAVILGFCHEEQLTQALIVFNKMKESGFLPDVHNYNILIDGFSMKAEFQKCHDLLNEMINVGIMPNVVTYSSLLLGLCIAGELESR
ncbi:hypothetical protein HPP92_022591 [Vanilla planifolia]|uniref:Pentatricopeptide repeat-containing protein n=1 Tax=Vanilla planifolia TaxID=51239 RepID=A0A835UC24_VANPL|nr:hypothetical protein HPP92_022591 [Vanilla planifolia]